MAVSPEIRLKRYLCYTNEANIYYSGCRFTAQRYTLEHVPSLKELIAEEKLEYILNLIKSIHDEQKSCYPDALLFVLSEIAKDIPKRPQALKVAEALCRKTDPFITFVKFCVESSPKVGFGRSFRKFVRNWYTNKHYLELAEIIGDRRKYKGWSHADLIKLSHVKCTDPAKAVSFKFAVHGIDAMKKEYAESESKDAKKIAEYFETVDEYRKKLNPEEVADKIDSYMLGYYQVSCDLHDNKQVWTSLLAQMPVLQILNNFQHLSKKKMFRSNRNWDVIFVETVADGLSRPYANRADVTINKVFIEMMNYENAGRVKMELAIKLKRIPKKPPIINSELTGAFLKLMERIYKEIKPVEKKIVIFIELSQEMVKRRCQVSRYIFLFEAAAFITYYFHQIESNVKVFTFNSNGIKPLTINKEGNVKQAIEAYKCEDVPETSGQKTKGDENIINWLKEQKNAAEEIDCCMILKSYLDNNSLHALTSAGPASKKIKFIVSDLCGIPKNSKPPDKKNLFVTSGFDDKIIEAMTHYMADVY